LPTVSSSQPGSTDGPSFALPYLALLLVGFTWHPASPSDPVSSYLTLSPLPVVAEAPAGGLLSVALSLGSPPLDVIQHHALWSPDFPPPRERRRLPGLLQPNLAASTFPQSLRKSSFVLVRRSAATPPRTSSTALTLRKIARCY